MNRTLKQYMIRITTILGSIIPDDIYLKMKYRMKTHKKLNLDNPILFNEKLQWLKINVNHEENGSLVDKYKVRKYIEKEIGKQYLIPLVGGPWKNQRDINFEMLPNQFVLKCTHDSGGLYICKDKSELKESDYKDIRKKIAGCMKTNYFLRSREYPYKYVKPQIIAEEYMVDESENELKDYKFFVFNGEVKCVQVDFGRFDNHRRNFYSPEWEFLEFELQYPSDRNVLIIKPNRIQEMIAIAEKLGENRKFVRVDLYSVNEKIYFGEITFFPGSGFERFTPEKWNKTFGEWIELPII